jgi:hypothetical protein
MRWCGLAVTALLGVQQLLDAAEDDVEAEGEAVALFDGAVPVGVALGLGRLRSSCFQFGADSFVRSTPSWTDAVIERQWAVDEVDDDVGSADDGPWGSPAAAGAAYGDSLTLTAATATAAMSDTIRSTRLGWAVATPQ